MKLVWIRQSTYPGEAGTYIGGHFDSFKEAAKACKSEDEPEHRKFPHYAPYPKLVNEKTGEEMTVEEFVEGIESLRVLNKILGIINVK